ncbi:potassium-transporting ATPase subunit KdpC [Comamonas aquatica]|jgi:K+-transporting ATPase ATPase C chain|uniref:Potassium-transporting ATPase KdpC subunit n=1 Tax=Comamonas aquatica TaxID=225991 RepID=A0AA35D5Q4_9BURK|nr:potassium-transporting ATPase subunit KdpC [Comamonas aquatica]CAB5662645.1 potassium-transporting ATPase subunit C [Comamonas aquatica]CAB5672673.1 potassium-transporting ATPase subunit C [Comamonas aquatica]CAC9210114.1 potassium-transporting ATPase subunit C [Comamonas aquatica]CAC9686610.1 potassium-transporting ATPase subunit C [Comamonas aquatica]
MTSSSSLRATAQAARSAIPSEGPAASLWQLVGSSARAALLVMLIAGVAYPLLTTGVAQILFPHAANGSLIERDGQAVGSALIGQQFVSDAYFQGRPSATLGADPAQPGASVPAPYNAGASGASNQGTTHQGLAEVVAQRVDQYRAVNGLAAQVAVPVDAVTASASGLDPHISLANAQLQVARVAKARGLTPDQVQQLVQDHTQPRTLFLLGEPRVHVLQLNLALDAAAPTTAKE